MAGSSSLAAKRLRGTLSPLSSWPLLSDEVARGRLEVGGRSPAGGAYGISAARSVSFPMARPAGGGRLAGERQRRLPMKALVYQGPGSRSWDDVPDPRITAPTDIVMRVDAVTICGTDLHILKGDVPEVAPGTILGHEAVGTVVETGDAVTTLAEGDRVLASCITSCGRCPSCRAGRYGLCTGGGGWILDHLIDGVQAEYARIPFADTSAYTIPSALTDEQVLFLADILPTSYEVGVLAGRIKPGDTVAIVGAGPIGLAAALTANLYTPARV